MSSHTPVRRAAALALTALALIGALTACKPEPVETTTPSPSATSTPTPSEAPSPEPTEEPSGDIALPGSCEEAYTPDLIAKMTSSGLPLNDPGLTMLSTELVDALDFLDTVPTVRCTWGLPSEVGIATNITLVTSDERDTLLAAYEERGFACETLADDPSQTRCTAEQTFTDPDGKRGEIQVFRGNAWLTTLWINVDMEGYADDMVTALWG